MFQFNDIIHTGSSFYKQVSCIKRIKVKNNKNNLDSLFNNSFKISLTYTGDKNGLKKLKLNLKNDNFIPFNMFDFYLLFNFFCQKQQMFQFPVFKERYNY